MKFCTIYYICLAGFSLITFFLYGIDKLKAKKNSWRISERLLLFLPLLGGCFGGFLGMLVFRHKTKHWYFFVVNVIAIILHVIVAIYVYDPPLFL